ncbi:MAG: MerR family transcriptional regulator [Lachnospiraceae bacterium]|nr:MerR family transcriptional regulator [Lachnospiraceae bacterium]
MRTVKEVSKLTGVSVRTLHYYDEIGLLHPTEVTEAGYRLYDDTALERLQHIMLFRELEFPLKDIRDIVNGSNFDRNRALEQQIQLLTLKKEHIENLITFARGIQGIGVKNMDFSAFDAKKMDEYVAQAKLAWGKTEAYKEYEQRAENISDKEKQQLADELMGFFKEFGQLVDKAPGDAVVQKQVEKLQNYITDNFYTCTNAILRALGKMYSGGGTITENIDAAGGKGTAEFVTKAIEIFCTGK